MTTRYIPTKRLLNAINELKSNSNQIRRLGDSLELKNIISPDENNFWYKHNKIRVSKLQNKYIIRVFEGSFLHRYCIDLEAKDVVWVRFKMNNHDSEKAPFEKEDKATLNIDDKWRE